MKENSDDLDEDLDMSLKIVRLEAAEDDEGVDEALAGDEACNLEITLGLSDLLAIGSVSSSSSSSS